MAVTPQEHYRQHLAAFYSWMAGDFQIGVDTFKATLVAWKLVIPSLSQPRETIALDLGAGHGMQTIALARAGYKVHAVDTCEDLLNELLDSSQLERTLNPLPLSIETHLADITQLDNLNELPVQADLIVCWGDTLPHLTSQEALVGTTQYITVKSDDHRIHTCILAYESSEVVLVTDQLYEKRTAENEKGWQQTISTYPKTRISPEEIIRHFDSIGGAVVKCVKEYGMVKLLVQKK